MEYAAEIARRYSAIVHLLHVVTPDLSTEALTPQALPADIDLERQAAADQLQSRAERLTGIQHKTWLEFGYVLDVVKTLIRAQHIDLIVVGTHGRSGFKKLVLGSVAEAIFREAACPVLTVGPKVRDLVAPESPVSRLHCETFGESHPRYVNRSLDVAYPAGILGIYPLTNFSMLESPENPSPRERGFLDLLKPWVSDLMAVHGISEADREYLIAHLESLPQQEEVREALQSSRSRSWKLGSLAAMFVVWKEKGQLPSEFSSFADRIREHAIHGGFHQ